MVAVLFIVFVVALAIGVPVAFSLGLASVAYMLGSHIQMINFAQYFFKGLDSFTLLCIPGFTFAGNLMNQGGISDKLLDFADALVGHITGGLAYANVLASMVFAGISGTALSDTVALGGVEIPMMVNQGYDVPFSVAITAASSCLGPIIPPSVPMIMAATMTGLSVSKMFMAGIVPGLLLGLGLGLGGSLVDGVAFLPPELTGAQERAGGFFPANHAAPLIVQHRQVTVRMQHMAEMVAEHRFAGGAHSKALFQRVRTACSDPGNFGGKAVYQLALLFQQAFGDQDGHRDVFMAGLLELRVHDALDVFPDRIAVWPQDRKALDGRILDQLRLAADIGVPLGKIDLHIGDLLDFLFFRHINSSFRKYFSVNGFILSHLSSVCT